MTVFKNNYLFLAVLGLHWCTQAFSSCSELELDCGCGARASPCGGFLAAEHGPRVHGVQGLPHVDSLAAAPRL